jgi:hypothetical protein
VVAATAMATADMMLARFLGRSMFDTGAEQLGRHGAHFT